MAPDRDGNPGRVIILIDTNAFLMAAQFTLNLYDELRWLCGAYQAVVPDVVMKELTGLSTRTGKNGSAARFGLRLATQCEQVETSGEPSSADDRIFSCAKKLGAVVVTNDRDLRTRLLAEGLSVISLRGRHKLEMISR